MALHSDLLFVDEKLTGRPATELDIQLNMVLKFLSSATKERFKRVRRLAFGCEPQGLYIVKMGDAFQARKTSFEILESAVDTMLCTSTVLYLDLQEVWLNLYIGAKPFKISNSYIVHMC